eukprot:748715-Hanusia_phi.AAC.2
MPIRRCSASSRWKMRATIAGSSMQRATRMTRSSGRETSRHAYEGDLTWLPVQIPSACSVADEADQVGDKTRAAGAELRQQISYMNKCEGDPYDRQLCYACNHILHMAYVEHEDNKDIELRACPEHAAFLGRGKLALRESSHLLSLPSSLTLLQGIRYSNEVLQKAIADILDKQILEGGIKGIQVDDEAGGEDLDSLEAAHDVIGLVGDNLGQFTISFGKGSKKPKKVPKSPLYAVDSFPSLKVRMWRIRPALLKPRGNRALVAFRKHLLHKKPRLKRIVPALAQLECVDSEGSCLATRVAEAEASGWIRAREGADDKDEWEAMLMVDGTMYPLGNFPSKEDATSAWTFAFRRVVEHADDKTLSCPFDKLDSICDDIARAVTSSSSGGASVMGGGAAGSGRLEVDEPCELSLARRFLLGEEEQDFMAAKYPMRSEEEDSIANTPCISRTSSVPSQCGGDSDMEMAVEGEHKGMREERLKTPPTRLPAEDGQEHASPSSVEEPVENLLRQEGKRLRDVETSIEGRCHDKVEEDVAKPFKRFAGTRWRCTVRRRGFIRLPLTALQSFIEDGKGSLKLRVRPKANRKELPKGAGDSGEGSMVVEVNENVSSQTNAVRKSKVDFSSDDDLPLVQELKTKSKEGAAAGRGEEKKTKSPAAIFDSDDDLPLSVKKSAFDSDDDLPLAVSVKK